MPATLLPGATGVLVLADGTVLQGLGCGAVGKAVGEVCFNTAMTGYQEILTDPSYAGQIITFTFPHIGNVGTNGEDMEAGSLVTGGVRIYPGGSGLEVFKGRVAGIPIEALYFFATVTFGSGTAIT